MLRVLMSGLAMSVGLFLALPVQAVPVTTTVQGSVDVADASNPAFSLTITFGGFAFVTTDDDNYYKGTPSELVKMSKETVEVFVEPSGGSAPVETMPP